MTQKLLLSVLKKSYNFKILRFKSSNFFSKPASKRYSSNQPNKPRQYTESCKLLNLDTDFSSKNYKPPNEKDIRTAFRKQARSRHPDTDSIPGSTPDDSYYKIVEARDFLLKYNNQNKQNVLNQTDTSQTSDNFPNPARPAEPVVEWSAKEKLQKINTANYGDIDFKFYPLILFIFGFFGYILWNSDLPGPDPKYPKGDGRHDRRRKQYEEKEQKRLEKLKKEQFERELEIWRKKAEYEELDSFGLNLESEKDAENDVGEVFVPSSYTSVMAFDNVVTGDEKSE